MKALPSTAAATGGPATATTTLIRFDPPTRPSVLPSGPAGPDRSGLAHRAQEVELAPVPDGLPSHADSCVHADIHVPAVSDCVLPPRFTLGRVHRASGRGRLLDRIGRDIRVPTFIVCWYVDLQFTGSFAGRSSMSAGAVNAGGGRTVPAARRLIAGALLILTACSAGSSSSSSDKPEATSSLDTSGGPPSSTGQALPEPIANDAPRIGLGAHISGKQVLPGGPDWLEVADGRLWVKRDDGRVSQIDLRTAEPTGQWSTGYSGVPACQGLTYDGKYLWSCAGENRVARHAPTTGGPADQIGVSRVSDQTRFVPSHDLLWVIDADATSLMGLDRASGDVVTTIDLGTFCIDLARPLDRDRGVVYAICPTDDLVIAVDVVAGKVTGRLQLAHPRAASIAHDLWVAFGEGLAQVDPSTLEVDAIYDVDLGLYGEIWADAHDVWARAPGKAMLTHIDPRQHRFLETLTSSTYPSEGDVPLATDNSLWTTASDDGVLLKR